MSERAFHGPQAVAPSTLGSSRLRWSLAIFGAFVLLAAWIIADLSSKTRHDLRDFDPAKVARLETSMWRSYYDHERLRLFSELGELLRRQYHLPLWSSWKGAFHAARAAVIFQKGRGREDYLRALPDLEKFYGLIHRHSQTSFDVRAVAALELEWWIVHRERARHSRRRLETALAELQSRIYGLPPSRFDEHARARAEAMLLRDARAESGGVSENDWQQIGALLNRSWLSLHHAVSAG
ncbi:MAG TPA: hypothetical protein VFL57_18145 [Bryobacteraceae bacterium]|nr:hypothetical protein [Bryobacteraceae bacterium]